MMIPPPVHDKSEELSSPPDEWVRDFLNVKSWKCPACGLTNFGRNKQCASCQEKPR